MGDCRLRLGENDAAVTAFQKSIEVGGLHASQCTLMAAALESLGQPEQALAWLNLACKIEPARAGELGMQAAMRELSDPSKNPVGSPTSADYSSGLVDINRWRKQDMPIKVYVRRNIQIPGSYNTFSETVRAAMDQWCEAASGNLSYKIVPALEQASLVWDYTDRPELVSTGQEPGLEGNSEMRLRMEDRSSAAGNVTILIKKGPNASNFKDRQHILSACLHEAGHALGLHGHSLNNQDVMFLAATINPVQKLSQRDKNTIQLVYRNTAKGN
jgi:predicted Zn-dependent protease